MRVWPRIIVLCSLAFAVATPTQVEAAPSKAKKAKAKKAKAKKLLAKGDSALARGDRHMDAGRLDKGLTAYEEALTAYSAAYDLLSNPQIYFLIALAEEKLGRYSDAMEHYQAMIKGSDNPSDQLVEQVEKAIAGVRKNLVSIDLIIEQDGAIVEVDGKKVGKSPLDGPHYMEPGKHTYIVTLEGYTPVEEHLFLEPGQMEERRFGLDRLPVKKPLETPRPVVKPYNEPASRTPLIVSFASAGAFLVGATFTGILAQSKHDRYKDENLSISSREKAQSSGKTLRLVTDGLIVAGVLAASYGAYYYYSSDFSSPEKQAAKSTAQANLWVAPYASSDEAGLALSMSF